MRNNRALTIEEERKKYVVKYLRQAHRWWPPRIACLKKASVGSFHRKCFSCNKVFPNIFVQADHIIPVIDPKEGFEIGEYAIRLLCGIENYQPLCKSCHRMKTNKENKLRRK